MEAANVKRECKKFIHEIAKNKSIQEQVVLLAQKANLVFTREDLIVALNEAELAALSEEELDAVSGGAYPTAVNNQITDSIT
jgi:hypothetical protein